MSGAIPIAPTLAIAVDTGAIGDGRTSNGKINVTGIVPGATWEYSTDGGLNWLDGSGDSFDLSEGEYADGDVQARQTDSAGNTSLAGTLDAITIYRVPPNAIVGVNSYVTLIDAHDIAETRLFAHHWNTSTELARTQALITATALLDRMGWSGRPLSSGQPLAWPRVADRAPAGCPATAEIPAAIQVACAELAIHLLKTGDFAGPPVMSRMLGDSMVMYYPTVPDDLPVHVRRLVGPFLRVSSANVAEVRF